jgi:hypothetical protein
MAKQFEIENHPVLRIPRPKDFFAAGRTQDEMLRLWQDANVRRAELIAQERTDPLRWGWEPNVWKLCCALLGFEWVDPLWAETVRKHMGYESAVNVLLILGGNRSGKTEFEMKSGMRILNLNDHSRAWLMHQKRQVSVDYHHSGQWRYMPPELKGKDRKERVTYISYKQKTGFSEDKFVLPNGSDCTFLNYTMDRDTAIEGGEIDYYAADELVPPDWIETLHYRIATRRGKGIVGFTPVNGYTATVGLFCDGAETVLDVPAFMVPKDGGEPDVVRALGFSSEEEMREYHRDGCWSKSPVLFDARGNPVEPLEVPEGRKFERAPRVLKCVDPRMAVVYFHTCDNPYGNPFEVAKTLLNKSDALRMERFYGVANKTVSACFPKFNRKVHVLPADQIPKKGTNYLIIDPAKGRNFFMKWYRVTKDAVYLYREWPSQCYAIPGQGVPGPWALPDGKKLDGKPGPAQKPFGFGLIDYLNEIARLEGWKDYEKLIQKLRKVKSKRGGDEGDLEELLEKISRAQDDADERIELRLIDSRAASEPKIENDRPVTLQTEFEDIGLDCGLTPGLSIDEGVDLVNDALAYDEELPISYLNSPNFYVSADCKNSIYSLSTWTGNDGNKQSKLVRQ